MFDEMDGLIKSGNEGINLNITAVLKNKLEEMQQHPHVFFAGATNNIDAIDPVVRASKRIPLQIPLSLPTDGQRQDLLQRLLILDQPSVLMAEMTQQGSQYDLQALTKATEGFSQGDISEVIIAVRRQQAVAQLRGEAMSAVLTQQQIEQGIQKAKITRS